MCCRISNFLCFFCLHANNLWIFLSLLLFMYQAQSGDNDHDPGSPFNPTHIGDSSMTQNDANVGVSSSAEATSHITRLASIDSFDSKWYWLYTFCFMHIICLYICPFSASLNKSDSLLCKISRCKPVAIYFLRFLLLPHMAIGN